MIKRQMVDFFLRAEKCELADLKSCSVTYDQECLTTVLKECADEVSADFAQQMNLVWTCGNKKHFLLAALELSKVGRHAEAILLCSHIGGKDE